MAPKKKEVIADSWDDDVPSDDETPASIKAQEEQSVDEDTDAQRKKTEPEFEDPHNYYSRRDTPDQAAIPEKRPEKSTAVINRIIASNLGIRNKQTPEQRQYHKSQIENEKKKREQERQKKQEEERLKQSVWED